MVFVVFCKESRICVGKKLIPTKKLFFCCELSIRIAVWKYQKQPLKGVPPKCFFSKVGNSMKINCERGWFLVKLLVESLELYWYLTPTQILFQGFSSDIFLKFRSRFFRNTPRRVLLKLVDTKYIIKTVKFINGQPLPCQAFLSVLLKT